MINHLKEIFDSTLEGFKSCSVSCCLGVQDTSPNGSSITVNISGRCSCSCRSAKVIPSISVKIQLTVSITTGTCSINPIIIPISMKIIILTVSVVIIGIGLALPRTIRSNRTVILSHRLRKVQHKHDVRRSRNHSDLFLTCGVCLKGDGVGTISIGTGHVLGGSNTIRLIPSLCTRRQDGGKQR